MTDFIDIADVLFVYSGGASNNNPLRSLGGIVSLHQIQGSINNLFPNITDDQSENGYIDYRCFYLKNNALTNTFYGATAWVEEVSGGSSVLLGISAITDQQKVAINGPIGGGSLTLSYEGTNFVVNYDPDSAVWAQNFEDAMNALSNLSGVSIVATPTGQDELFNITFGGDNVNRLQGLLVLEANNLIPANAVTITKYIAGGPINTQAPIIATPATVPANVTFASYTTAVPLTVGTILPGDATPFWIKRTTAAGVSPMRNDGFGFRLVGRPF